MRKHPTGRSTRLRVAAALLAVPLALGACGDDEDDAGTVAPTAEASPELDDITDDYFGDASYIGRTVTVQGTVSEVFTPSSFVLAGDAYGDESLLVISATAMDPQVGEDVEVTGVVREFGYDAYAEEYGLGDEATAYGDFDGEEILVAGGSAGSAGASPPPTASPSPTG